MAVVSLKEYFHSYEKLFTTEFPSHDQFYSTPKQSNISIERYNSALEVFNNLLEKNMMHCLRYYNNSNVKWFYNAILKCREHYDSKNIDVFEDLYSLSGASI